MSNVSDAPDLYDLFDVNAAMKTPEKPRPDDQTQPLYQIYEGSKIAVGKALGKMCQCKVEAARATYEHIYSIWEEVFKYYNYDHQRTLNTPKGVFKRGDGTENVIFSNLNVMLPAVYSKDPDVTCSASDEGDEKFTKCLQALLNGLFKRKDGLNAKPHIKRAAGMALLTNCGIIKLNFTRKSDSKELALQEMERMTQELAACETQEEVDRIYGEFEALERNMEVLEPSGFNLNGVLPHNLVIDPYAEQADGMDSRWMAERVFFQTNYLTARFTKNEDDDADPEDDYANTNRVLIYKPTHKARFAAGGSGSRDDGIGLVMDALDARGSAPTSNTDDERTAYINMYYTECWFFWDKATRRLLLFAAGDWAWPIWVWDDPLGLSRFFPYFIMSFTMSTGGTVSPGESAYILDQQDEINDIERQKSRIRRSVFDYFFYNNQKIKKDEAEKFVQALRGETRNAKHAIGVDAGEAKVSECIEALVPPSAQYDKLFDKAPVLETINRITNTSDALRGVQFKTNTTEDAVQSYMESLKLSVGAKVDVIEDTVSDLANAVAEVSVQFMDEEQVSGIVGPLLAQDWQQLTVDEFRSQYNVTIVAGSMEKPNSIFKKKEAIQIAQAIGQFAQAAPGITLRIMLKVMQNAFTDVVIKPEDWAALDQEIKMNLSRGVSDGSTQGGAPPGGAGGPPQQGDVRSQAMNLPPEIKQKVVQMKNAGASDDQLRQVIMQAVQQNSGAQQQPGSQRSIGNGAA
jgi:hypothetical protein